RADAVAVGHPVGLAIGAVGLTHLDVGNARCPIQRDLPIRLAEGTVEADRLRLGDDKVAIGLNRYLDVVAIPGDARPGLRPGKRWESHQRDQQEERQTGTLHRAELSHTPVLSRL